MITGDKSPCWLLNVIKEQTMRLVYFGIIALTLTACATQSPLKGRKSIDQVPMYGGMNRSSVPRLKAADERLVEGSLRKYGNREKAAAELVERGIRFYLQGDLAFAMKRFNQAWILNPDNPEVYWGFASVLKEQESYCEAMNMIDKSLSFGRYFTGLYADAGRIIVLCTVSDSSLSLDQRKKRLQRAETLYAEASRRDDNKGYVFASRATACYWLGDYADAWRMVKKAREAGTPPQDEFLSMLRKKMPEPPTM